MTEEQIIQAIMMEAFADEFEKISSTRELSEMEKVAIWKKYIKPGLVAAGLMAGGGGKAVAQQATKAPVTQAAGKFVEGVGRVNRGAQTQMRTAPGWRVRPGTAMSGADFLGQTKKAAARRAVLARLGLL